MPINPQTAATFYLSLLLLTTATGCTASPTAYEVLESYDFPAGIIPKGVTGYDLDRSTGKFNGYFNDTCSFSLDGSYKLRYNNQISGYIYKDRLTNLSGVSVKVLFLWLDIIEVRREGDNLVFSVGFTTTEFSVDNFFFSPQCGCGLNCDPANENWGRSNFFVSDI